MQPLARRASEIFSDAAARLGQHAVDPAIPILYFGDLTAYLRSPLRVVTVGLNPSRLEFPGDSPFRRFSNAANLLPIRADTYDTYFDSLDNYFETDPYEDWFKSFNSVLCPLTASFWPGCTNFVIHTDICSPVATDRGWNKLPPWAKAHLLEKGPGLWRDLIALLKPHILLAPVRGEYLLKAGLPDVRSWTTLYDCECHPSKTARFMYAQLSPDQKSLVIHGPCFNKPFLPFGRTDKQKIGGRILTEYGRA